MVNIGKKKSSKKPKKSSKKSPAKKTKKAAKKKFSVSEHYLVPKHTKLSETEKKKVLDEYKVTLGEFPRINIADPAIAHLELGTDDLIKIERPSPTTKTTVFYRRVVK